MQEEDRWSREIACLDQRNRLRRGNLLLVEIRHIRTIGGDRSIVHGYHHKSVPVSQAC